MLDEFLAADTVVIGAPMYNFTVPTQLKAWIDRIVIAGTTFSYGANGPEGLVRDKRVIIAITRGNFYGEGSPAAALRTLPKRYLKAVFNFIGVEPEFVIADGLAVSPSSASRRSKARSSRSSRWPPEPSLPGRVSPCALRHPGVNQASLPLLRLSARMAIAQPKPRRWLGAAPAIGIGKAQSIAMIAQTRK